MSTSSTYHIPFPKNFLSLNTPVKRTGNAAIPSNDLSVAAVAQLPEQPAHGFLSNRSASMPRHASVSSASSVSSTSAASESAGRSPPSLPAKDARSPSVSEASFAPLALNTRHAPLPPSSHREMGERGVKSWFLTNRR